MNFKILKFLFCAIFLACFINSCKKDNKANSPVISLKGLYEAVDSINLYAPEMYTSNGLVNNPKLLEPYFGGLIISHAQLTPFKNNSLKVNFKDDGHVTVSLVFDDGTLSSNEFTINDKSSTGFVLKAVNTVKDQFTPSKKKLKGVDAIVEDSNLINPFSDCVPQNVDIPFLGDKCTFRDTKAFIVENDQIYLSYYSLSISDVFQDGISIENVQGVFNTNVFKQLTPGDTLIVQRKALLLRKK
jgi:hypothetical protein